MRKWMLKVHLWVSLLVGIFFVAICLSGSVLVMREDIKEWMHPELYQTTPGMVSLETIRHNAEQELSGYRVTQLETPEMADGRFHVRLSKDEEGKTKNQDLYLDPGTGNVLGKTENGDGAFLTFMIKLHEYLLLGDAFGRDTARYVESAMGVGLAIALITGGFVWWPGLRRFFKGFKIMFGKGKLILQRDLHKSLGILSLPFLLVLALTGSAFTLDKNVFAWFGAPTKEDAPKELIAIKGSGQAMPLDLLVNQVLQSYPDTKLMRINLPKSKNQATRLYFEDGYSPTTNGNMNLYIDQYSGKVLWKSNPSSKLSLYSAWKSGLHFGTWGGTFSKVLYVVIGLLPLFFMITGVAIWRMKARLRKRRPAPVKKSVVQEV